MFQLKLAGHGTEAHQVISAHHTHSQALNQAAQEVHHGTGVILIDIPDRHRLTLPQIHDDQHRLGLPPAAHIRPIHAHDPDRQPLALFALRSACSCRSRQTDLWLSETRNACAAPCRCCAGSNPTPTSTPPAFATAGFDPLDPLRLDNAGTCGDIVSNGSGRLRPSDWGCP